MDELPPYFRNAITQSVAAGTLADITTFAVSNLLAAALKLKRLCIVISNLSGAYEGATKDITAMVAKATRDLQNEAGRQAKGITPVELGSDEIYHILRTSTSDQAYRPEGRGRRCHCFFRLYFGRR